MSTPRRQNRRLPESRVERGLKLRREQSQLGAVIIAIDTAFRALNRLVDRSEERCRPRGTGSVIGSVVQVPRANPDHETHFDFLETVRETLEGLVIGMEVSTSVADLKWAMSELDLRTNDEAILARTNEIRTRLDNHEKKLRSAARKAVEAAER